MAKRKSAQDQMRVAFVCTERFHSRISHVAFHKGVTIAEYARSLVSRDVDEFERLNGIILSDRE